MMSSQEVSNSLHQVPSCVKTAPKIQMFLWEFSSGMTPDIGGVICSLLARDLMQHRRQARPRILPARIVDPCAARIVSRTGPRWHDVRDLDELVLPARPLPARR